MILVNVNSEKLEALRRRAGNINPDGLARIGGRAAVGMLVSHFQKLDAERPNKLGGQRTHFFGNAARATADGSNPRVSNGVASIEIKSLGLAQRRFGGTIKAGKGISRATGQLTKYLAIPARAEAYGKTPGEFDDLEFVPFKSGKRGRGGMLVEKFLTPLTGKNGKRLKNPSRGAESRTQGGLVMYWLVPEVRQDADPSVMPTDQAIADVAADQMQRELNSRLKN